MQIALKNLEKIKTTLYSATIELQDNTGTVLKTQTFKLNTLNTNWKTQLKNNIETWITATKTELTEHTNIRTILETELSKVVV